MSEPDTFWPCALLGGCWDRPTCGGCETEFLPLDADIEGGYQRWKSAVKPVAQDWHYFMGNWESLPELRHFVELAMAKRIVE